MLEPNHQTTRYLTFDYIALDIMNVDTSTQPTE